MEGCGSLRTFKVLEEKKVFSLFIIPRELQAAGHTDGAGHMDVDGHTDGAVHTDGAGHMDGAGHTDGAGYMDVAGHTDGAGHTVGSLSCDKRSPAIQHQWSHLPFPYLVPASC